MRILLPVDLTEPVGFTRQAEELAERFGADLLVLHVNAAEVAAAATPVDTLPVVGGFTPYSFYDPALEENIEQAQEDAFQAFLIERFEGPVRAALQKGDPAAVILEDAAEQEVDLIVLGKRRYGQLERLFLGSVADKVIKKTKHPTLLLPVEAEEE